MTIQARNYIETAFSVEDAEKINPVINEALAENDKVIVDFSGITFFTTLFFSSAITHYLKDIGHDAYNQKFEIIGLTNVGQSAYQHSLEYALEVLNMTPEDIRAKLFAIDSIISEGNKHGT